MLELSIVAALSATVLTLFELAIVATFRASFLTTVAIAIPGVTPEFSAGDAALAADAIIIRANVTAAFAALDPRLAIALLAGIVASVFDAIL